MIRAAICDKIAVTPFPCPLRAGGILSMIEGARMQ